MSTIDRAFVKAYAKESAEPATSSDAAGATKASGHAAAPAVVWVDPVDDQYLRLDAIDSGPGPHSSRPRGGQPARSQSPLPGQGGAANSSRTTTTDRSTSGVGAAPAGWDDAQPMRGDAAHAATVANHGNRASSSAAAADTAYADTWNSYEVAAREWDSQLFAPITIETQGYQGVPSSDVAEAADQRQPAPTAEQLQDAAGSASTDTATADTATADTAPAPSAFEAAWEVDRFELPELVVQLMTEGNLLASAGVPLAEACRGGLETLLVTSPGRSEGKTSVAMGLALAVASRGLRVALLDGDCRNAALADRFRLEIQFGWAEAIRGGLALEETAVHSLEDSLTLLPLVPAEDGKGIAADELGRALAELRKRFDLVIVDAGSSEDGWPTDLPRRAIDAALVIRDCRISDPESLAICLETLRAAGITSLGLADNFAP